MLTLTIKKKWFDMILSGEKKEEYREIKPYYETRFMNVYGIAWIYGGIKVKGRESPIKEILFRNGYSKESPQFVAKCALHTGTGKEEWGAEPEKEYYVLKIHEITERRNC